MTSWPRARSACAVRSPSGSGRVTRRRTPHTGAKKSAPARCLSSAPGIGAERAPHRQRRRHARFRPPRCRRAARSGRETATRLRRKAAWPAIGVRQEPSSTARKARSAAERGRGVADHRWRPADAHVRVSPSRASIAMRPARPRAKTPRSQNRRRGVGEPQPFEPGERQQSGVDLAGIELAQARLDIAADVHHREIGAQPLDHRLPAQRCGADDSAVREVRARCRSLRLMKTSRDILARQHATIASPTGSTVGMSLAECTARSIRLASSASSISLVNRPLPPTSASGRSGSCRRWCGSSRSRCARAPAPCAAASRACTCRAWTSASGLPRVPMRRHGVFGRRLHPMTSQCYADPYRPSAVDLKFLLL